MDIKTEAWGETGTGEAVKLFTLTNANGVRARISNYGGIVVSLEAPDRNGDLANVVLGFDDLESYLGGHPYFGAIVGRYANRIAGGRFTLDGVEYTLATNNGPNHLHGGLRGFDKLVWAAEALETAAGPSLALRYTSPAGEESYPGRVDVEVVYTLTNRDELRIDYRATSDRRTPLNLTNHSYFNLKDAGASPILEHELVLRADQYLPTDDTLIPTGRLASVAGTPLDFTSAHAIGARIARIEGDHFAGGYDHCYVLDRAPSSDLLLAATVFEPTTGRVLEMHTTEPGVQLYTGNFLDGSLEGPDGATFEKHHGFCLEAQHFPDSVNQPTFPSVILEPGATYTQTTVYRFATRG